MPDRVLHALVWDADGTLAETKRDGHRVAFNQAFEALGLPWHWSEARYGGLHRRRDWRPARASWRHDSRPVPIDPGEALTLNDLIAWHGCL